MALKILSVIADIISIFTFLYGIIRLWGRPSQEGGELVDAASSPFSLPSGDSLSWLLIGAGLLIFIGLRARGIYSYFRSFGPYRIEFYNTRSEKNRIRGDLEKELAESSEVWFAAIGGDQVSQLAASEVFKNFTRIIINDPESEHMKRISTIQPIRGKSLPEIARRAIETCQNREKAIKLSDNFVLNVIISDPDKPDAWARVQSFFPYFEGPSSPSFVVYKEDRPELFDIIKGSFERMWKAGKVPV